jgi:pimeloyl-ACP methyl ester carboxylesterase
MERPLHNAGSVPSIEGFPDHDIRGFVYGVNLPLWPGYPTKAIPAEDWQFQSDAVALLTAIHDHNPDALIVLVGHSMGGDAVARLAAYPWIDYIDIDLVAPIDPVGNRTCIRTDAAGSLLPTCNGLVNFTRWRATHQDWVLDPLRRQFGPNVKYLYHRWQQEFMPPFDYSCPEGTPVWPCLWFPALENYLFEVDAGTTNDQGRASTLWFSGWDVPEYDPLGGVLGSGGTVDGHGEIVGFRGVMDKDLQTSLLEIVGFIVNPLELVEAVLGLDMLNVESFPLALKTRGDWPLAGCDLQATATETRAQRCRVFHMKKWEKDPSHLYKAGFEPWNPGLCMVSRDLCNILDTITVEPSSLVADAGPDQIVECSGPSGAEVTLDGSGSTGPNDDSLFFAWDWSGETMTGETIDLYLPVGAHSITLTVDDGEGNTDTDTVVVTVVDSIAPSLSVSLSPDSLWPPNHRMVSITASIQVGDTCDTSPNVELVSIISDEADNGWGDGSTSDDIQGASLGTDDRTFSLRAERTGLRRGRIYTVTYGAIDASGNVTEASAEVTVPANRRRW